MSEWIDLFIYAILIVAFWFAAPRWATRFALLNVADRDPDWVAGHPEAASQLASSRWYLRVCQIFGALSLGALLSLQIGLWPHASSAAPERWQLLRDIAAASMLVGLVFSVACGTLFSRWLGKQVPLAERRQAVLEPRAIDDFVPRWLRYLTYTLVAAQWSAWVFVGAVGFHVGPNFWAQFVTAILFSTIFYFLTRVSVNRPPGSLDRIFGPDYRRGEVRYSFLLELSVPVLLGLRLYAYTKDGFIVDPDRLLWLALQLLLALGILRFGLYMNRNSRPGRYSIEMRGEVPTP